MSMTSDNVANANTTGFKASHARFGDMVSSYLSTQSVNTDREGSGSALLGISTSFGQGPMLGTDTWSDLAINGQGFFNLQQLSSGAVTGNVYYTRDGSFRMDQNGYLVNSQGYAVLGYQGNTPPATGDPGGDPIQIDDPTAPVYKNYNITTDGRIVGTPIDPATGVDPVILGAIRMSSFPNQEGLVRQGANLYMQGPTSGAAINAQANASGNGSLVDNNIEGSNVDLATEMVNMIIYQADYNANSKSVTAGNTMVDTVINMVR
jgi:flagellar hook protein FlgE